MQLMSGRTEKFPTAFKSSSPEGESAVDSASIQHLRHLRIFDAEIGTHSGGILHGTRSFRGF